ncbi:MAG: hypothetical protein FWH40_02530 [Coriobacteriia bacterium]|nr:hypothetical protein [Coriobacteriia bacterium]
MAYPITYRWRIHDGVLPLRQRHMRDLSKLNLPNSLTAWVHERLEWAMLNLLTKGSEAVLVLHIDPAHEVRLSLDDVREAPALTLDDLCVADGLVLGVEKPMPSCMPACMPAPSTSCNPSPMPSTNPSPMPPPNPSPMSSPNPQDEGSMDASLTMTGDVWFEQEGELFASVVDLSTATSTLCRDLAETLGFKVNVGLQPKEALFQAASSNQAFVISDEFGFIPIGSEGGMESAAGGETATTRLRLAFAKLW